MEMVALSATDEERAQMHDQVGQLYSDLRDSGYDVTCGHEATPDGDVFRFAIEGDAPPD